MQPRCYIAVIDDDESHCRSLARLLLQAGFQVITYSSAEEFLTDRLRAHFDCLLADIQLGGMSGFELLERLGKEGDSTPIVFLTASDDPLARSQAQAMGCLAYFRKTDSGAEIIAAMRRVAST